MYTSKLWVNKLYLLKNFVELKNKEGTPITNHLSGFQGHFDQLFRVCIKFDEDLLRLFLLNSLPDSWETFRVSMISVVPNGDVSLQMANSGALYKEIDHDDGDRVTNTISDDRILLHDLDAIKLVFNESM
uniref:Retrovirus-related Pol polyprotein from transposon TNT 1-94 n=1 Tax=Cajanus cajan TaxID=3821 RepID=A0A151SPQ7_CAJCA|nr:Retrovirus-related Pol polyprotein from transposon TNT 1-94 [Cajanus cajan]